jgi:hypothetical protein
VQGLPAHFDVVAQAADWLTVGRHIQLQELTMLGLGAETGQLVQVREDVHVRVDNQSHRPQLESPPCWRSKTLKT